MSESSKRRLTGQRRKVLRYLLSNHAITDVEARAQLGVARLASRIPELREMGLEFAVSRPEKGKRYVAYHLTNPDAGRALLEGGSEC